MKFYGNVKGGTYPVTQQEYEKPIDATRQCGYCGRKFAYDPEIRLRAYCSHECKRKAQVRHVRNSKKRAAYRVRVSA